MFLHLGGDVVIPIKDIISIIDITSVTKSKDTRKFLKIAEEEGSVYRITDEEPKSCIITKQRKSKMKGSKNRVKTILYYSHISSTTLQKRAEFMEDIHL